VLPNGTSYVLALQATSPQGTSSWTPEVTVTPNPSAPPAPAGFSIDPAHQSASLEATSAPNTTYRLLRRTARTPYAEVGTFPTPFVEEALTNGVQTTWLLQQATSQGTSPWTPARSATASHLAPLAPTITTVIEGTNEVALQWTPVAGATGYRVSTSLTVTGPFASVGSLSGAATTRTSVSVPPGSTRFITVRALGASSDGTRSVVVSGATSAGALGSPFVTALGSSQANELYWAAIPNALGYLVSRRGVGGPDWRPVASVTSLRYVDQNVEAGETFEYAVQTVGPQGPGTWSGFRTPTVVSPGLVRQVTIRPGNGSAAVEWSPVPGASGYVVRTDPSRTGSFASTACNLSSSGEFETRCRVSGVNGVPLFVVVSAVQNFAWAPGTPTPLAATPDPARPTSPSLSVAGAGPGRLQLTMGAVPGATGYRIFRRTESTPYTLVQTTPMTTWVDMGLTTGTPYWYLVEAENAVGPGAPSSSVSRLAP
jgi:predicted RNA-binding protein with TRAM domain